MTTILASGDVAISRQDQLAILDGCRDTLASADICFAQLEAPISARGSKAPNARLAMRSPVEWAAALREAGIDVVSCAGNHCLDYGYEALFDTFRLLDAAGIRRCGAGEQLTEALDPAILQAGDHRVAFIAASSILPEGYAAQHEKPGCAPMRAFTVYEAIEPDQPGTPARVRTFPHAEDLSNLVRQISAARQIADVVIVSLHWGIHMTPFVLADYQITTARKLIDAGADAILGHHPHILKGVDLYRNRPIFYSLGNFAIGQPHEWDPAILRAPSFKHLIELHPEWDLTRQYMLPENTRYTGLAKLLIKQNGDVACRFCPAWIGDGSEPHMLSSNDPKFHAVREFLAESNRKAGLAARIEQDADELIFS